MPHCDIKFHIHLQLTHEEFRLIGLALARRLAGDEDIQNALQLNVQLQELRAKQVAGWLDVCEGAFNVAKAQAAKGGGDAVSQP